jgi:hypothetical protein
MKGKRKAARTRSRAAVGYPSQIGCARGELMLVESAAKKCASEIRMVAERLERMAACIRNACDRIDPNRKS